MTNTESAKKKRRDPRLDFFRGVCLVIIYIAHIWDNPWASFIPARFGFSDATEIFVFCSGMASAVAFGDVFVRRGVAIGVARIAHRCWQVYWSHVATFLVVAALMVAADKGFGTGGKYLDGLGLEAAFGEHSRDAVLGLLTLTFVPHFFDILPMYLIILVLLPMVVVAADVHKGLAFAVVSALWIVASTGRLDLPAQPWAIGMPDATTWFFNPFSWQLIFFTGFAFMRGWLPPPRVDRRWIWICAAFTALSVPFAWSPALDWLPVLREGRAWLEPAVDKTHFGLLRFVHFLCIAYLAYVAVGEHGSRLTGRFVDVLRRLGQQSLAVFIAGLVLSFVASIALNYTGRNVVAVAVVNLGGIGILILIAGLVGWFKSMPWKHERVPNRVPTTVREMTGNK